jgi:hypothetical protein
MCGAPGHGNNPENNAGRRHWTKADCSRALPPPEYTIATIQQGFDVQASSITLPVDPSFVTLRKVDISSLIIQFLAELLAAALTRWVSMVVCAVSGHRKAQQHDGAQVRARPTDRDRYGGRGGLLAWRWNSRGPANTELFMRYPIGYAYI